jgi:hypothetical protein
VPNVRHLVQRSIDPAWCAARFPLMLCENFTFISQLQIPGVKKPNFYFSEFLGPAINVSVSLTLFSPDLFFSNMCFLVISDERDAIQKKTFTKWVNKHLKKVKYRYILIMTELL